MLIDPKRIGPARDALASPIPTNEKNAGSNPPAKAVKSFSRTDLVPRTSERKHHLLRDRMQKLQKPPTDPWMLYAFAWSGVRVTDLSERPKTCADCMFYSPATAHEGLCVPPTMSPSLVAAIGGEDVIAGCRDAACKQSLLFAVKK
jgi:hypothetical protein